MSYQQLLSCGQILQNSALHWTESLWTEQPHIPMSHLCWSNRHNCVVPWGHSLTLLNQRVIKGYNATGCLLLRCTHRTISCNQPQIKLARLEVSQTVVRCLPLELFQRFYPQSSLGLGLSVSAQAKVLVYYLVVSLWNGFLFHVMLFKVEAVLVKAVHYPPMLILSWISSESHSSRDLHILRNTPRSVPWPVLMLAKA